jgi:mRNA interferase RelE/StbE
MALTFEIIYSTAVVEEDIPRLAPSWRDKIRSAIEEKLFEYPDVYGKPLRRSIKGYRKLRVGDYRIIFRIAGSKVLILAILHRSVAYREMEERR